MQIKAKNPQNRAQKPIFSLKCPILLFQLLTDPTNHQNFFLKVDLNQIRYQKRKYKVFLESRSPKQGPKTYFQLKNALFCCFSRYSCPHTHQITIEFFGEVDLNQIRHQKQKCKVFLESRSSKQGPETYFQLKMLYFAVYTCSSCSQIHQITIIFFLKVDLNQIRYQKRKYKVFLESRSPKQGPKTYFQLKNALFCCFSRYSCPHTHQITIEFFGEVDLNQIRHQKQKCKVFLESRSSKQGPETYFQLKMLYFAVYTCSSCSQIHQITIIFFLKVDLNQIRYQKRKYKVFLESRSPKQGPKTYFQLKNALFGCFYMFQLLIHPTNSP